MEGDSQLFDTDEDIEIVDQELLQRQRQLKAKQAAVGRKSKRKGAGYENGLARKIAAYFGWKGTDAFILSRSHPLAGQKQGDLIPIKQMAVLWFERNFGPLEAKNREEWAFNQFFNPNLDKNPVYKYWLESNANTETENSIIFFTKNNVHDFVFHRAVDAQYGPTALHLQIANVGFIIQTLDQFMIQNFDVGPYKN